jgi:hypothetical protein
MSVSFFSLYEESSLSTKERDHELTNVSLKAFFLMEEAALHCLPKEKKSSHNQPLNEAD